MRFALDAEQRQLAGALRDLLTAADVPSTARAWAAGDAAPGRKLWQRLDELGLGELAGHPVELVVAFEELGRAAVPGPYVESMAVLPALGVETGGALATLAMPPHVPHALDAALADAVYLVEAGRLSRAAVAADVRSVDPARRLATVSASEALGAADASAALDRGALATAAQLVGLGYGVLHRSTDYARQRRQFGKPIGSFQALKQQLADAYVGLEFARPLQFGAALSLGGPDSARDVSAARVAAGDAAYRAARTALQVHGAIGYTAEYDLSLWLLKVRALVSAWGTARVHRDRVLAALRASGGAA